MTEHSWKEVRKLIYEQASGCCEYCQTCEVNTGQTMQVDHINPSGSDEIDNLALACWNCNNHKRQATEALDPETNITVPLFHPRSDTWSDHFQWIDNYIRISGRTATGRATILRLKMNRPTIVIARKRWVDASYHSPSLLD